MMERKKETLIQLPQEYRPVEFHHGGCIGADAEARAIVQKYCATATVIIHPPADLRLRAFCRADSYMVASSDVARDLVDQCDILVAAPGTSGEGQGSETWAAITCARERNVTVVVLEP